MKQIEIKRSSDLPHSKFEVTIRDSRLTSHIVTLSQDYYEKLTAGSVSADELIEASFEFLLAREPNTSILPEFDLKVISDYFPAYEREMKSRYRTS